MRIEALRKEYHRKICQQILYVGSENIPNLADQNSQASIDLAWGIIKQLDLPLQPTPATFEIEAIFEEITKWYIDQAFSLLTHLRPGKWVFSTLQRFMEINEYQHLADLKDILNDRQDLKATLGNYLIMPDILISRSSISDEEINQNDPIVEPQSLPSLTPLREKNSKDPLPILHASISCKLTLRSDRSQNARTEGLNLIRNRKGHTPHIAVVTAEPMPTRISSLALGTGDIDCVYHFALYELLAAAEATKNEAVTELLEIMIEGKRLRDISDLPFDLAI